MRRPAILGLVLGVSTRAVRFRILPLFLLPSLQARPGFAFAYVPVGLSAFSNGLRCARRRKCSESSFYAVVAAVVHHPALFQSHTLLCPAFIYAQSFFSTAIELLSAPHLTFQINSTFLNFFSQLFHYFQIHS